MNPTDFSKCRPFPTAPMGGNVGSPFRHGLFSYNGPERDGIRPGDSLVVRYSATPQPGRICLFLTPKGFQVRRYLEVPQPDRQWIPVGFVVEIISGKEFEK